MAINQEANKSFIKGALRAFDSAINRLEDAKRLKKQAQKHLDTRREDLEQALAAAYNLSEEEVKDKLIDLDPEEWSFDQLHAILSAAPEDPLELNSAYD